MCPLVKLIYSYSPILTFHSVSFNTHCGWIHLLGFSTSDSPEKEPNWLILSSYGLLAALKVGCHWDMLWTECLCSLKILTLKP